MNDIRTDKTLRNEFRRGLHDWQCKKLNPIEDLSYVVLNLLKTKFVVEIDGNKYDISFGVNDKTGEVGYGWSASPSPSLTSWEIIEKAFRIGKWYEVTDKNLTEEETNAILAPIKEKEKRETEEFLKECFQRCRKVNNLDK